MLATTALTGAGLPNNRLAGHQSAQNRPAQHRPVRLVPFGSSPAAGLTHRRGPTTDIEIIVDVVLKTNAKGVSTPQDARVVVSWLAENHLRATRQGAAFHISARVETISKLLHVHFSDYQSAGQTSGTGTGRTVYASTRPYVPSTVASSLGGIIGLNDLAVAMPAIGIRPIRPGGLAPSAAVVQPNGGATPNGGVTACAAATNAATVASAVTLNVVGNHYGVNNLLAAGDEGAGVTIALVEMAASNPTDISTYDSCFGLNNSNVSVVHVDGGGASGGSGTLEADLDIEQLQTQAPLAHVISYEGPNGTVSDFYDVLNAIVTANTAKVISISWGSCEAYTSGMLAYNLDPLFEKAAQQGQSVFVASGDNGSEDCNSITTTESSTLGVDSPASDPYVTAVGGTSFNGAGDVVWNDCANATSITCSQTGGGAGGGGISSYFTTPSWQSAVNPTGHRSVPDISAYAYVNEIYYQGAWTNVYGTSAAAPLVAGMVADIVPTCATAIGNLAPRLYAYGAAYGYGTALTDVTSGNNDWTDAFGHADYQAGTGYDLASGLGTPIATGLICPSVASVSASSGVPGDSVTITGTNLTHTTVDFGTVPATITSAAATSLTVTAPNDSGMVDITVASPIGGAAGVPFAYNAPLITSASSTSFVAGQAGSFTVTTSGYSSPTISTSGLPYDNQLQGLILTDNGNGTGTLSGTIPVSSGGGVTTLPISASDASGVTTQTLTITVYAAPTFYPVSNETEIVGQPYSFQVAAIGYPAPAVSIIGTLPSGITFGPSNSGPTFGGDVVYGTPAQSGTFPLAFTATSSAGSVSFTFTITVAAAPPPPPPPPTTQPPVQTPTTQPPAPAPQPPTTATSKPKPVPAVTLRSSGIKIAGTGAPVPVSCADAACSGTVTLSVSRATTVHRGKRIVRWVKVFRYGVARYRIPAGRTAVVRVTLDAAGRTALARAKRISVLQTVTVIGGATIVRRVILTIAPAVTLLSARVAVRSGVVPVTLACTGATCSGTVVLGITKTVTKLVGKKVVHVAEITRYGVARYRIPAGRTAVVRVTLDAAGRTALAGAKSHTVNVTQEATVGGGTTVRRSTVGDLYDR